MKCLRCRKTIESEVFFSSVVSWWNWLESFEFCCPSCLHRQPFVVRGDTIIFGYPSPAFPSNFVEIARERVEGLKIWQGSQRFEVVLCGQTWTISKDCPVCGSSRGSAVDDFNGGAVR